MVRIHIFQEEAIVLQKTFSLENIINLFFLLPAYILMFLMLVFPMVLELLYVKVFLFSIVLLFVGFKVLSTGNLGLHPIVLLWILFLTSVSMFFVVRGFIAMTPGALKQAQVYILWPLIYTILISGITDLKILLGLQKVLVIATICIGLYGVNYFLTYIGVLPEFMDIHIFTQGRAIGLYNGYTEISFQGLSSLPFLVPFIIASLVTYYPSNSNKPISRICLWVALITGITITLISGRRALLLVTVSAPIFIFLLRLFQPRSEKSLSKKTMFHLFIVTTLCFCGLFCYMYSIGNLDLTNFSQMILKGFDFSEYANADALARREQFFALIKGWSQKPLIGAGHGAFVSESIRSDSMPWAYELYYLALLFQTGIIGFLLYAISIIWIYFMGIKVIRKGGALGQIMLPTLVGLSCLLVANATNPYFMRFDGIWVIFLPVAVINYWMLSQSRIGSHKNNIKF